MPGARPVTRRRRLAPLPSFSRANAVNDCCDCCGDCCTVELLVCGLPAALGQRFGRPLWRRSAFEQTSGKALNCNLIRTIGANRRPGLRGWALGGQEHARVDLRSRNTAAPPRDRAAASVPSYSVNRELTDSSLDIRVIVSARSCAHESWRMRLHARASSDNGIVSVTTISSSCDSAMRATAPPDNTGCVQYAITF